MARQFALPFEAFDRVVVNSINFEPWSFGGVPIIWDADEDDTLSIRAWHRHFLNFRLTRNNDNLGIVRSIA